MNPILLKILRKRFKPALFILSGFGLLLGLSLVLICIQVYLSLFKSFSDEIAKADFLVLSKKINIANTIFNANAIISDEEIKDLKSQPFVESIAPFTPNRYTVYAQLTGRTSFGTELFFESLPDTYVDVSTSDFFWHPGQSLVPIIVSEDFLNLYNYGYALGSGLPQISRSTVSLVRMKITLTGKKGKSTFDAKIVGFSERISSVLVPQSFMDWANREVGGFTDTEKPARLIIKVNKKYASRIPQYLADKSLHINSEKLGASKMGAIARIVLDILIVIGVLFIMFSFVILLMNFAIIIAEARPDLILLFQLGYKVKTVTKHLFVFLSAFIGIVVVLSFVLFFTGWVYAVKVLNERAISLSKNIQPELFLYTILIIFLLLSIGLLNLSRTISKQKI